MAKYSSRQQVTCLPSTMEDRDIVGLHVWNDHSAKNSIAGAERSRGWSGLGACHYTGGVLTPVWQCVGRANSHRAFFRRPFSALSLRHTRSRSRGFSIAIGALRLGSNENAVDDSPTVLNQVGAACALLRTIDGCQQAAKGGSCTEPRCQCVSHSQGLWIRIAHASCGVTWKAVAGNCLS